MKTAVVLFNLGGPDKPESIQPFLYNLFNDPAIISLPWPARPLLAKLISTRRAPEAAHIYEKLGGRSPLLELTQQQANALEKRLSREGEYKIFTCMRYWHPMSEEVAAQVKNYAPDEVIFLPLYPQFSTTTSRSSFEDFRKALGTKFPISTACCYPTDPSLVTAHVMRIKETMAGMDPSTTRILFSAHGLPQKIVDKGDPYQWQIEQTAEAIVEKLGIENLDWNVCYQSRVGPLKWLEPSTESEITRAGAEGRSLLVVPVAFVSEHSETLVELDIQYKELAEKSGVREYRRAPALGTEEAFIESLATTCMKLRGAHRTCSNTGKRLCPSAFSQCATK
ncbi:MAG: ferrochelatase [Alphaproteobacteria bacterium]|nr:ferrochelatase [Alphaproteobacteria bacterium]